MTLEDAWTGGLCRVTLDPPIQPRHHLVRIPPGIADGQAIRLPGRGRRATDGSRGDLYLTVHLTPHPVFRVDGRDVAVCIPVAPWEAVLGARVPIETPAGRVDVRIPAGCSSGRRLCLRGRGLPNPHGDAGDLVVTVRITVPKQLSRVDRMLFERLAKTSDFDARRSAERRIA
jgi:curved DNA-binding protein